MHLDLTLSGWNLEFEKQSHTLLEYVIGGGTGELPPKDMKFRYLVCDLLIGLKLHCGCFICYLVGEIYCYILNLCFSFLLHILLYHSAGLLGMLFVPSYCTLEST